MIGAVLVLIAIGGIEEAVAPRIEPISQQRVVEVQATYDAQRIEADGYDLFHDSIEMVEKRPTVYAKSTASQYSWIGSLIFAARGASHTQAITEIGDIIVSQGCSSFDYEFMVLQPIACTFICDFVATGKYDFYAAGAVRLTTPTGIYVIDEYIVPGEARRIIVTTKLKTGVNRLQIITRSLAILGFFPDEEIVEASFSALMVLEEDCVADLNDDRVVNVQDLSTLLSLWGTEPDGPPDFNFDNIIDQEDMDILLSLWGDCPPS